MEGVPAGSERGTQGAAEIGQARPCRRPSPTSAGRKPHGLAAEECAEPGQLVGRPVGEVAFALALEGTRERRPGCRSTPTLTESTLGRRRSRSASLAWQLRRCVGYVGRRVAEEPAEDAIVG